MTYKRIGVWTLTILVAAEFCLAGTAKFGAASRWVAMFARWGYPDWSRPLIGAAEVVCGLALVAPRTRKWACAALACIMVGATVTLLVHGENSHAVAPVVLFGLLGLLARVPPL
ncbi:MAG TPA: DoxX family protein [Vicinamibacterales bacterium]|nr:DoxX family protein [Vicinamibacterales bacterium]